MAKANISRDVQIEATLSLYPEQLVGVDDMEQLMEAVKKATEKDFSDNPSRDGTGLTDVSVTIEFDGYKTTEREELNTEDVKKMTETELEDVVADFSIMAEAVDNGIEHEGYHSSDWYSPDEPAYVEGYDDDEIGDVILESVEKAFKEFGIEIIEHEIDDFSIPEWSDVIIDREESAREAAEEARFEAYHEGLYDY